jgi:hypothetical protein
MASTIAGCRRESYTHVGLGRSGPLRIWGTSYVLHRFVPDNPDDPLARQRGLRPDQNIR